MEKTTAVFAVFVLLCLAMDATADTSFLVKVGVDAAKFNQEDRTNKYGLSAGVGGHVDRSFNRGVVLGGQLEVSYVQRGSDAVVNDNLQSSIRMHYLDWVLTARPAMRFGVVEPYVLLGAGLCVLMNAKNRNDSNVTEDITGNLHRVDVLLAMGAGVAYRPFAVRSSGFGLDALFIEARYERGLVDIDTMDLGIENRNAALLLGASFALGAPRR